MLRLLRLQNFVLVDREEISFGPGFNVLSGETGAGKSAVMGALALVLGQRADASLVRRGCARAVVEAVFSLSSEAPIYEAMERAGLDICEEEVVIRRELSTSGKSRALVNDQVVSLNTLRSIAGTLVDLVGQDANHQLRQPHSHLLLLDEFAGSSLELREFQTSWKEEKTLQRALLEARLTEEQRERELMLLEEQVQELRDANLQEGEEEELFAEYTRLTHAETILKELSFLQGELEEREGAILERLRSLRSTVDHLISLDGEFQDISQMLKEALVNLEEMSFALRQKAGGGEFNPQRQSWVNDRLAEWTRLKRKYGRGGNELCLYQRELEEQWEKLGRGEQFLEELEEKVQKAQKKTRHSSEQLRKIRKNCMASFSEQLKEQLQQLNMPHAEWEIRWNPCERSDRGEDQVEFYLHPNIGEAAVSVREGVSGGELARVMLALKMVLSDKDRIFCLVFDEVDANIGGETATVVGKKLRELGEKRQVLCITHFAQVARQAHRHFQISKTELDGRTLTSIRKLSAEEREEEFLRMVGGEMLV